MRVAHYMPHYPGRDGSAAFCRGLSRAMNRIVPGSCPIITLRPGGTEPGPDEELLHYSWQGSWNRFRLPPAMLDDLATNRHRLDGMVLHGTYNPPMAALGRHLRKIGMPYLFIPHDPYVPELTRHHRWRKLAYWHAFEKPLIEGARVVQVLDASHERYLRERGCRVPVVAIPNGCEPEMLAEIPATARIPGAGEDVRILYFGRMDRNHKGLDLLLEAFARALRDDPEASGKVTLVMTGNDWTDRGWLELAARRLGLAGRVEFTGRREEGAMKIVAEADLVVLPSRFDGFGLCVVEAMLAARPVLVSRRAGVASHVAAAGAGWVVDPDVASISRGLCQALRCRDQWPAKGLAGQRHVLEKLTWDQVARTTLRAYEEFLT
jgi:glycosyltransferase involved in cell wall biosynthesis